MRTSYSAIETYLQCPQKYKFQEINRIKTPKNPEAVFGTLVHNTLKFMFSRDPLFPTLDEIVNYFRSNWPAPTEINDKSAIKSWGPVENKAYFAEGVRFLKSFYEKNAPWNFTVVDLESHFEIPLEDKNGSIHILAGKIDRIDKLPNGTYEIIDYKTAKRMPSQAALNKNLQLSLYSLGLQKRWPHLKPEDIKLSLYFLKHGEKLSAQIKPEVLLDTKNQLLKTVALIQGKISSGKEFEPVPGPLCDWCGYKPICPAWKHLYKQTQSPKLKTQNEIKDIIKEYFALKKNEQVNKTQLAQLQGQIKEFMAQEGVTRVFGEEGVISQKNQQRYEYDWEKIKNILSPLGKWEEVLKADEKKLLKVLGEIPEDIRSSVEKERRVVKEYTILTASAKKAPA